MSSRLWLWIFAAQNDDSLIAEILLNLTMREFMVDLRLVVCQVWSQCHLLRFINSLQKLDFPLHAFFSTKVNPPLWLNTYAVNVCVGGNIINQVATAYEHSDFWWINCGAMLRCKLKRQKTLGNGKQVPLPNIYDRLQFAKLSKEFLTWGNKGEKAVFRSIKCLDAPLTQMNMTR